MVEAVVGVALRAILASVLLGGVLAMLVLLAVRSLALTASTRHALWTTALVATAVMPLAGVGVSMWRAAPQAASPAASAGAAWTPTAERAARAPAPSTIAAARTARAEKPNAAAAPASPSLGERFALAGWTPRMSRELALALVGIWALGALAGLAGLAASIVRVRGLKRRSSPLDGTLADELPWLTALEGREIYLRLSYETETPVAIGFRRPVILIPTELATADGLAAIEQLVMHEHAHLRRYDDWTNLLQRTIERIFWFNPVVWLVGRRIALEREIASDDAVVEKTGEAHAYATSLWRLAREMRMPEHAVVAPGALLTRKQISVRIEQLLDKKRSRLHGSPAAALGLVAASVLAVGLVATSAPAVELPTPQIAAQLSPQREFRQSSTIFVEKHVLHVTKANAALAVVPPEPPAAPAAPSRFPQRLGRVETTAALAAARARVRVASEVPGIGTEMARVISDAMATIPREISQASAAPRRQLSGVKLSRETIASCIGCSLKSADLRGMDLHGLRINGLDLGGADLRDANLSGASLTGVNLSHANLERADLRNTQLNGVELHGSSFNGAQLEGIKLLGVSLQHVSLRGIALRSVIANCTGCDFGHMDLRGQDLRGITLNGADLNHADLRDANLSGVHFRGVDLSYANLTGADLSNGQFDGCDMSHAALQGARTTGMTLHGSSLDG